MCIYYPISFTKSICFLLNFQVPFMFWIIILPLNILYYPTNESIRFSNNLIFLTVLRFIVISATFCQVFAGFSPAFGLGLGAVLGISAVSATFFWIFFGFWVDFGSCFKSFMDYSSTRACLLCYQPMAIVHYANLVLLNKYTFLTEVGTRAPGTDGAPVLSCRHIAKQFRYC